MGKRNQYSYSKFQREIKKKKKKAEKLAKKHGTDEEGLVEGEAGTDDSEE